MRSAKSHTLAIIGSLNVYCAAKLTKGSARQRISRMDAGGFRGTRLSTKSKMARDPKRLNSHSNGFSTAEPCRRKAQASSDSNETSNHTSEVVRQGFG